MIVLYILVACWIQISCASSLSSGLEKNRRIWNESKIDDYRMKVKIMKTGHATPMGVVAIEVRDGKPVSTTWAEGRSTGQPVQNCHPYDTIPEIFGLIDDAEKHDPEELEVSYDPTLGYPVRLKMDPRRTTMDDELSWEVLQFERID